MPADILTGNSQLSEHKTVQQYFDPSYFVENSPLIIYDNYTSYTGSTDKDDRVKILKKVKQL